MYHSSRDFVVLVATLQNKMARVVGDLMRRRGATGATDEVTEAMKTARRLHHRFNGVGTPNRKPDLRHDDREEGQVLHLANWLLEKHAELNGQTPNVPDWNRQQLREKSA